MKNLNKGPMFPNTVSWWNHLEMDVAKKNIEMSPLDIKIDRIKWCKTCNDVLIYHVCVIRPFYTQTCDFQATKII